MDKNRLSTLLFYFSITLFIIAFNFAHNPPSAWYQQFLPDLNGQPISSIAFTDSLNGYSVTNNNMPGDSGYILKTTNGGDNWRIVLKDKMDLSKVTFLNSTIGFACGGTGGGTPKLYKTTNSGVNWFLVNSPFTAFYNDMKVLNEDTIWLVDNDGLTGGVYRTINRGASWTRQFPISAKHIYFFNNRIGFVDIDVQNALWKTTNSGENWFSVGNYSFEDMYFTDSLNGWLANGNMLKTTNGGLNWTPQRLPPEGGIISTSVINNFENINRDTIWGVGAIAFYGNNRFRGLIYKTTNGGQTWGYQQPRYFNKYFQVFFYKFC